MSQQAGLVMPLQSASVSQQDATRKPRLLDRLFDLCAAVSAFCIAAICILMMLQSLSREFGLAVKGVDDIVGWLCAASAFLILGHAFQHGGIVRVELLFDKMPEHKRRGFELFALSISNIFGLYALYAMGSFVYQSWELHDLSQGQIVVPLWIPQVFMLIGCAVFCLALADEFLRVIRGQKPRYQVAQEAKLAAGDFGEGI